MTRLSAGSTAPALDLVSITGEPIAIPGSPGLVHLQFRRFAGCPVCHLHLRSFVRAADRLAAVGVQEVVFFHASRDELLKHAADLPFPVIADAEKRHYRAYGVEAGRRALFDPRAWSAVVRGVALSAWRLLRGRAKAPSLAPEGGRFGLPADLLIGPDGRILAVKYGEHADDQWSVDEVIALARAHTGGGSRVAV